MRKRVRKKLRLAEFQELAFQVTCTLVPSQEHSADMTLLDDLIDFVESHDLFIGGVFGGGAPARFHVTRDRASATDADRELIAAWLRARPEVVVASLMVGSLEDAWHEGAPVGGRRL